MPPKRVDGGALRVAIRVCGKLALYLDCGTEDVFLRNDQAPYLHDLLLAKKIDHAYYIGAGRHDFSLWELRVPESLKFLRDQIAKPQS